MVHIVTGCNCVCMCVCVRDAWSRLGEMSKENAMAAYVDEMKKVAQEVRHTFYKFIYFKPVS